MVKLIVLKNLKKILFFVLFFIYFFKYFLLLKSFPNSTYSNYVLNYLYAIKKIYEEDIFVKDNLYNIFKNKIDNLFQNQKESITKEKIDEIFKNTLYFYSNDRYLKIYQSDIFNQEYLNENKIEKIQKNNDLIEIEKDLYDKINISVILRDGFIFYYIKIFYFPPGYYKYFRDYLFSFYKEEQKHLKKIVIIDLVDNVGGSLYTASFFINLFYPDKTYLFTIHYKRKSVNYYSGQDYKNYFKNSMVFVVQNDLTASASEVVSGVLSRKGIILGDFSYGKPFIQVNINVNDFTILYTNSFLNFNTFLEPHDKVKPDIFLNERELNEKFILDLVFSICYYLFSQTDGN
ncbi:MAG: S41 family peptidase [bacterium]|nr:S41 family peptidase [bacterium]